MGSDSSNPGKQCSTTGELPGRTSYFGPAFEYATHRILGSSFFGITS